MSGRDSEGFGGHGWPSTDYDVRLGDPDSATADSAPAADSHPQPQSSPAADSHPQPRPAANSHPDSTERPTVYLEQPTRQIPVIRPEQLVSVRPEPPQDSRSRPEPRAADSPEADERPTEPRGLDDRQAPRESEDLTQPFAVGPPPVPPAPTMATPLRIDPADGQGKPARGPRRGLPILLAVLLVVGMGGVSAVPDVANRLALPWAPNAPTGPEPEPVAVTRSLPGPDDGAPAPTAEGVQAALRAVTANPALGSLSGSVVDPATGTVLWQSDAGRPLPPASTTKVLTAAAALLALDPTSRITTRVVAGERPGSVVLVAGGDPTLSSLPEGKDSVYPGAARLDDLVGQVRDATGGAVEEVSVDLTAYRGSDRGPGWSPEDAPSTYAAKAVPAMLDGGRTDPTRTDSPRVADPATTLAAELAERLGARVGSPRTTTAPAGAEVLGEVHSAPLTELVDTLLTDSDNVLAEAVARQTAIALGREPSFAGAADATQEVLRRDGFDVSGLALSDGSGLSEDNRIPARLLTDVLAAAAAPDESAPLTGKLRPLLGGLPVAGGSGTLADRFGAAAADGKGWVRAKTGTLSEVNTLAGVVLDVDGRVLVFALMSAGSSADRARPALDAITATLRGCGCR